MSEAILRENAKKKPGQKALRVVVVQGGAIEAVLVHGD
jgi:hypothetical protein